MSPGFLFEKSEGSFAPKPATLRDLTKSGALPELMPERDSGEFDADARARKKCSLWMCYPLTSTSGTSDASHDQGTSHEKRSGPCPSTLLSHGSRKVTFLSKRSVASRRLA